MKQIKLIFISFFNRILKITFASHETYSTIILLKQDIQSATFQETLKNVHNDLSGKKIKIGFKTTYLP